MHPYVLHYSGSILNMSALNPRSESREKANETEMFWTNHRSLPAYLQWTEPAQRRSSTQTAETSFWLPGAFHSSTPAIYTRHTDWRWKGTWVTLSNCTQISHCVSDQLPAPITSGVEPWEAGINWLSWNSSTVRELRCSFKQIPSFNSDCSGKTARWEHRTLLIGAPWWNDETKFSQEADMS